MTIFVIKKLFEVLGNIFRDDSSITSKFNLYGQHLESVQITCLMLQSNHNVSKFEFENDESTLLELLTLTDS